MKKAVIRGLIIGLAIVLIAMFGMAPGIIDLAVLVPIFILIAILAAVVYIAKNRKG